ncbi:MAG: GFA family protein [Myxococcota bacterium]
MYLEGSCHCRAVRFQLESPHPYPFNLCYCSICRKTSGGGGFAINISGDYSTLEVQGREHLRVYRARLKSSDATSEDEPRPSQGQRHFCGECGSPLWMWDPRWPELVHPLASAIDTELPIPPERTHLLLASKATWVVPRPDSSDQLFDGFPRESIAAWHKRLGL